MCLHCKVNHLNDLKTIDHDIVTKREKINNILTKQICERHPCKHYSKYCEPCALPVCTHCREHRTHRCLDIQRAYRINRQKQQEIINIIRSEALFQKTVLLTGIKVDVKTCLTEFALFESEMLTKAQRLKNLIDKDLHHIDLKHRCLKQMIKMNRHIAILQRHEHKYEQSSINPVQFLLSIKATYFQKVHFTLHTSQLSMTELHPNGKNVVDSLTSIQIREKGKRRIKNECLLKLMSGPELHQFYENSGSTCVHISRATSDRVWVSKSSIIGLISTTGGILQRQGCLMKCIDDFDDDCGSHTVNNKNELFYIYLSSIFKLSKNGKTTKLFIETRSSWEPRCLYWSPYSGDLLVAMVI